MKYEIKLSSCFAVVRKFLFHIGQAVRRKSRQYRRWIYAVLILLLALSGFVCYTNRVIDKMKVKVFSLETLPPRQVALLLGASKKTRRGLDNLYFSARIEAAAKLYHCGKIRHILISGDNSRKNYDEPTDMKNELLARRIPASAITLDYAGFRTLDSIVRARKVFCCRRLTIITQHGHLERALHIAEQNGIDAIGFAAAEPTQLWIRFKNRCRERLARAAAWLDLQLWKRSPKFLGKQLPIPGAGA